MSILAKIVRAFKGEPEVSDPSEMNPEARRLVMAHIVHQIRRMYRYSANFSTTDSTKEISATKPNVRVDVALAGFKTIELISNKQFGQLPELNEFTQDVTRHVSNWSLKNAANEAISVAVRAKLPLTTDQALTAIILASADDDIDTFKNCIRLCKSLDQPLDILVCDELVAMKERILSHRHMDAHKIAAKIDELVRLTNPQNNDPLQKGEPFGDQINAVYAQMTPTAKSIWSPLIAHSLSASASKPTEKWLKTAKLLIEPIDSVEFHEIVKQWFKSYTDAPRPVGIDWRHTEFLASKQVENHLLIKGFVWCASIRELNLASAVGDLGIASFKKIPQVGAKSVKVGNACIWTLGVLGTLDAAAQLSRLNIRVKYFVALEMINKALREVADKLELTTEDVDELCAPTFGLDERGVRVEEFGDCRAKLQFENGQTSLTWISSDGKSLASAPAAVKKDFAAEVKELAGTVKEIAKAYSTQKERIERILLNDRTWKYSIWRERYLNHPLVGDLTRRLVWTITSPTESTEVIFAHGELIDVDGKPKVDISDDTDVRLWHPLGEEPSKVFAWRQLLENKEIRQPFKQAHREIFVVTDGELLTDNYSNRFAAHILRQHQFAALCRERGWHFQLLGAYDNHNVPIRELTAFGMRVEYWVEASQEFPMSEAYVSLYVSTDRVRFGSLEGGLVRMTDVAPRVFSEIMRDIDLFVGVCSVANDPNWMDQGDQPLRNGYWYGYSFGDLSASAETRRDLLSRLLPKLKFGKNAWLTDKFLYVKGKIRTYKIHLGSGNILMEPNDQYLCIVPDRSKPHNDKVFLPFEGDQTLALILSKAFLLFADDKIKDPVILRQIK